MCRPTWYQPISIDTARLESDRDRIVQLGGDISDRLNRDESIEFVLNEAQLNRLIVRCAEETVFYRDDSPWVQPFVAKNRQYRIEPITQELATPTGTFPISTQRIVAGSPPE